MRTYFGILTRDSEIRKINLQLLGMLEITLQWGEPLMIIFAIVIHLNYFIVIFMEFRRKMKAINLSSRSIYRVGILFIITVKCNKLRSNNQNQQQQQK